MCALHCTQQKPILGNPRPIEIHRVSLDSSVHLPRFLPSPSLLHKAATEIFRSLEPNKAASPPGVRFVQEPKVAFVESSHTAERSVNMEDQYYQNFVSNQVTDDMLEKAAKLFSENYGTWGRGSHSPGR